MLKSWNAPPRFWNGPQCSDFTRLLNGVRLFNTDCTIKITSACYIVDVLSHWTVKLDRLMSCFTAETRTGSLNQNVFKKNTQQFYLKAVQEAEITRLRCCFLHGVSQLHGATSAPPPVMTRHGRRRPRSLGYTARQLDLGLRVSPLEINILSFQWGKGAVEFWILIGPKISWLVS